ncbi:hypothetical protein Q0Q01_26480, partial [Escherichia coli O8:H10]
AIPPAQILKNCLLLTCMGSLLSFFIYVDIVSNGDLESLRFAGIAVKVQNRLVLLALEELPPEYHNVTRPVPIQLTKSEQ